MKKFAFGFISCIVALIAGLVSACNNDGFKQCMVITVHTFIRALFFGEAPGYYSAKRPHRRSVNYSRYYDPDELERCFEKEVRENT